VTALCADRAQLPFFRRLRPHVGNRYLDRGGRVWRRWFVECRIQKSRSATQPIGYAPSNRLISRQKPISCTRNFGVPLPVSWRSNFNFLSHHENTLCHRHPWLIPRVRSRRARSVQQPSGRLVVRCSISKCCSNSGAGHRRHPQPDRLRPAVAECNGTHQRGRRPRPHDREDRADERADYGRLPLRQRSDQCRRLPAAPGRRRRGVPRRDLRPDPVHAAPVPSAK